MPLSASALPSKKDLRELLKTAVDPAAVRSAHVSLSIPDVFAKTSVIDFEELPDGERERGEVIRWKAARDSFLKPDDCVVGYQLLRSATAGGGAKKVLAVVAGRDMVEGCEDALSELGGRVERISIHSLNIFNLFSDMARDPSAADRDFVLLILWKGYLSFLAFKKGLPDFYRCKEADGPQALFQETLTSLAFYSGRNPEVRFDRVWYLLGLDGGLREKLKEITEAPVGEVMPEDILKMAEGVEIEGADTLTVLSAAGAAIAP